MARSGCLYFVAGLAENSISSLEAFPIGARGTSGCTEPVAAERERRMRRRSVERLTKHGVLSYVLGSFNPHVLESSSDSDIWVGVVHGGSCLFRMAGSPSDTDQKMSGRQLG